MKAGYKTSEFWVTGLTLVVVALSHFGLLTPDQASEVTETGASLINEAWGLIALVLGSSAYTLGRSLVKSKQ